MKVSYIMKWWKPKMNILSKDDREYTKLFDEGRLKPKYVDDLFLLSKSYLLRLPSS